MNVAVTRAKRLCVLIGDSGNVNKNPFLKGLVDYFKNNGGIIRSAFDYQGNPDVRIMYGNKDQTVTQEDIITKNNTKVEKKKSYEEKKKKNKKPK